MKSITWAEKNTVHLQQNSFKAKWQLYVPPAVTLRNQAFCHSAQSSVPTTLTVNTDYFPAQH
jgi:hypothetical protein